MSGMKEPYRQSSSLREPTPILETEEFFTPSHEPSSVKYQPIPW